MFYRIFRRITRGMRRLRRQLLPIINSFIVSRGGAKKVVLCAYVLLVCLLFFVLFGEKYDAFFVLFSQFFSFFS